MSDNDTSINFEAVSVSMTELERGFRVKQGATEAYNDLVKAVAAAAKMEPAVLRAYVSARMADRSAKDKRKAEQLSLCFETLGA